MFQSVKLCTYLFSGIWLLDTLGLANNRIIKAVVATMIDGGIVVTLVRCGCCCCGYCGVAMPLGRHISTVLLLLLLAGSILLLLLLLLRLLLILLLLLVLLLLLLVLLVLAVLDLRRTP